MEQCSLVWARISLPTHPQFLVVYFSPAGKNRLTSSWNPTTGISLQIILTQGHQQHVSLLWLHIETWDTVYLYTQESSNVRYQVPFHHEALFKKNDGGQGMVEYQVKALEIILYILFFFIFRIKQLISFSAKASKVAFPFCIFQNFLLSSNFKTSCSFILNCFFTVFQILQIRVFFLQNYPHTSSDR